MEKCSLIFLILTAILVLLHEVGSVDHYEINQIKAGATFANSLAEAMQSKRFSDVIQKSASIIPGISVVASFVGFILSLVGTSPSQELLAVKRLFNEMDSRFDSVERHLQDIQREIKWGQVQSQFGHIEQEINTVYGFLKNIYTHPLKTRIEDKDYFVKSFENTCTNCAMDLYHGIIGTDSVLTGDILKIAMDSFQYDRKQTQNFMIGTLQLLLRGIQSEITYRKLKYGDLNLNLYLHEWGQRFRNVTERMQSIDEQVKGKYHDQAGKDIDRIAADQHTLSNGAFSTYLYNFLKKKYFWRDWLVVIYNPINGGSNHMNQQCDGFTKYRFHGRNMVVASVDSMTTSVNKTQANVTISKLPTSFSYSTGGTCGGYYQGYHDCYSNTIYNADQVYNGFPDNIKLYCSPFAADGVIDIHSDIHYQAPPDRLFHTTTTGIKPYEVYMFG